MRLREAASCRPTGAASGNCYAAVVVRSVAHRACIEAVVRCYPLITSLSQCYTCVLLYIKQTSKWIFLKYIFSLDSFFRILLFFKVRINKKTGEVSRKLYLSILIWALFKHCRLWDACSNNKGAWLWFPTMWSTAALLLAFTNCTLLAGKIFLIDAAKYTTDCPILLKNV